MANRKNSKSQSTRLVLKRSHSFPHESDSLIFIKRTRDNCEVTEAEQCIFNRTQRRQKKLLELHRQERIQNEKDIIVIEDDSSSTHSDEEPQLKTLTDESITEATAADTPPLSDEKKVLFDCIPETVEEIFIFGNVIGAETVENIERESDENSRLKEPNEADLFFKNILYYRR